jgi:thioredoxin 1
MNIFGKLISTVFTLQLAMLSGCGQIDKWTNDPPKITSFTVPTEVQYGETVQFKVRAFDPEDDTLTYSWDVSAGTLIGDTEPEVRWTAPERPIEEMTPPTAVKVAVYVQDGGEEHVSKSTSIIVSSKAYKVAQALSGVYKLVRTQVNGEPIEEVGTMRLTTTTFTREFQNTNQFLSGSYKLVAPYDERKGTIHWFSDGNPVPTVSTYTWDGQLLVLFLPDVSTQYVYSRTGSDSGGLKPDDVTIDDGGEDVEPVPVEPVNKPVEVVDEDVEPEPVDDDEEEVEPEPINADGKPIEITDATFKALVLEAKLPVVLEFGADWCPFCRQMRPIVEAVALEHRDTFIIGQLDIDENRQTTGKYKVRGIPAYIVFRDGEEIARTAGAMPKAVFVKKILDALK